MKTLRRHRVLVNSALACLMAAWQIGQPLKAATINWTAGSGLNFDWAESTNWSSGVPTSADDAIFGTPVPFSTPGIALGAGSVANSLSFLDNYTLTGGDLTLTSGGIRVNLGQSVTINSLLSGSAGLTKTGGGSVRLANASNDYTGVTTIANGTIIISSQAALGASSSAVEITDGNTTPSNVSTIGFFGGSLLLDGSAGGFTFSRDLNLSGQGPIGGRGATLNSLGNNTLSGIITSSVSSLVPATFRNTRINSVNGTLTLSGTVNAQGTSATTFLSLGGINTAGVGNYNLTGTLSGTGSVEKSGAGTLFLNPSSVSGFTGTLRISASATGQQSSVRVTQASVGGTSIFGGNTATTTGSAIDLNGGVLEFRSDSSLNIGVLPTGRNVYTRNAGIIFTGPAEGGQGINQVTTLGALHQNASATAGTNTTTFNGRNGYGVTLTTLASDASTSTSTLTTTLANNLGGELRFTGNLTMPEGSTASRPRVLAFGGNGNTFLQGSIIAGTDPGKSVTKSGTGSLTILGVATTVAGPITISAGAIIATDFRSLGNNTSSITLGNATTTPGHLIIGTTTAATAPGLTTSKPIVINGTSASNSIYANQAGLNPVVLNGAFTKPIVGDSTFNLGGTSAADNIITTGIPNLGTGGLLKVGSGTWVLAGENLYAGATNIVNGTLKLKANAASSTILAAANDITFGNSNVYAGGTLEFVGQDGVNNVQALDVLTTTSGASTIRLTPGVGGTASLSFASQSTGGAGTVNFVGADFLNNKITITGANGLISRTNYWNGSNFAYRESNVLRAPVYGTDTGFVTSASALTAAANMEITGSFATNTLSISTLKIAGSRTLTINPAQTLTLSAGGVLVTSGNAVITGGTALALGSQTLVVRTNLPGDSLDIQSVVTGSGGLTKGGAGTLILSAANNQSGTVTINEGTIQLSGSGRLGAAAALTMRQGTVLDLNGVTPSTNTNAFNSNGSVTSASPATFTVGGADGTGTSFGTVDGAVSLTKIGTGAQSWLGASTYTGVTTIGSTGLVTVNTLADGGSPSGIGQSSSAASNLVFNGSSGGLVYQGSIVNGILTLGSRSATTDRLFTLAGTGATLSSTASNNNAIVWSNDGAIVHAVTGPQSLIFTGTSTGDNTFNPQLTDSGTGANITSLTKTAAGQWNLGNSNNTYTGSTTINNGILALNDNGALPSGSPLVLTPTSATSVAVLQMSGTFERSLTATPTAGTGDLNFGFSIASTTGGAGFAAHSTPLIVAIGGVGSPTALTWGSGGFVGTGGVQNLVLNSTTALSSVDFRNAIDLGASVRTINVLDNGNTGADFASMSGVLSGAGGGLLKIGSGNLRLTGANSYTGTTAVEAGTIVVTSLGSSTGPATSSVGAGGVAMTDANAIVLGNATTTGGLLQYVGPGETSDRKIRLRGTTAGNQIHADGSGPLVLTNVAHDTAETGNKTLSLRGTNTAGNMITSQLSNNGAGVLSIGVDGGATWILTNGANDYTGTTTVGAGALGIGHDTAIGAALTISNGNVFAYGGDRSIANTLNLGNNATSGFIGDYSLTFNGTNNLAAGANNVILNNSIVSGKALTFNILLADSLTATRSWTIDGPGETVVNDSFTTSTAFGVNIVKTGNGTLTLGTDGSASNWNQAGNVLDLDRGILKFTADNAIPTASSANGGLTISPELATTDTATVDLNGTTQTVNALSAITDGTTIIDNTSSTAATLRFGANDSAVNFGSGVGSYTITDSGAGALSIVKLGNTNAVFSSGLTFTYQGATRVEGGSLTIASPVNGTTSLEVINSGSVLALTGGLPSAGAVTSVVVENGGTLSLLDGAGNKLNGLNNLQLGSTAGTMSTLNLNVGDGNTEGDNNNTDLLTLLTGGTLSLFTGNQVTLNLTDAGLNAEQTYNLISVVDGGLTLGSLGMGDWLLGATPGGFTFITLNRTDTLISITTGELITGASYWTGLTSNAWNGANNNWSTDKAGTTPAATIPGQGTDVVFVADSHAGGALVTTLEQNFKINSLTFEASSATPASVTINPGAVSTNRLEIAPQDDADGIAITTGGPAAVTITAPLRIGKDQTWNVADSGATMTLSGGLQGEANVTKTGAGRVILSLAADPTFNSGTTAVFTITGGNLEFTDSAALGSNGNSNVVDIVVSGGGFYYNNAVAGTALTLPHDITLSGGALSGGGANHTYGGPVTVSSASTINMADSNGAPSATARSITLAGVVSGSGSLTIDSNNTVSNGNQLGGTLTINNAASSWNGDLLFNRGTVTITAAASASVLPDDVTFSSFGRLILQGVDGQTINRAGGLTYAAGSVGEFQVDNTTATQVTDFTVNQNGPVNLGAGGTGASVRIVLADTLAKLNIAGSVTLGGNSSISVSNNAARLLTISGIIGDGGSGYSLAINDDAGAWAQTNGIVRLTGLNTFTGNISLDSGILEFDTVTNISGGASSLGNGTAILTTNAANLRFIGSSAQSTNRPITTAGGALTLSANGATAADTITYNGLITVGPTADGSQIVLTGAAGREGIITGGISQTGDAADFTVNGGVWTLHTGTSRIGDDVTITGAGTTLTVDSGVLQVRDDFTVTANSILNLNAAGVLSFNITTLSADASLRATGGGVINLGASNAVVTTEFDGLRIGTDAAGIGTLNMSTFNQSVTEFVLGNRQSDRSGVVNGTGILTVTGNLDIYGGTINANLASTGSTAFEKISLNTATLSGDNSGLASTGASILYEGTLILDYTTSNTTKLRAASALDIRGGHLQLNGNSSAATSQSVGSITLANGIGNSLITLNPGAGQELVLNLGAITRVVNARAGTLRIVLPGGVQSATNGVTTTTGLTNGIVGTAGYLTVEDGTGTWFATKTGNNIVALASTAKNDISTWATGDHITDETTGFTGTFASVSINSLRFDAAAGSDVNLGGTGVLGIATGGILITDNVGGTPSIIGGTIFSGAQASNVPELILTHDGSTTFTLGSDIRTNTAFVKSGAGTAILSGNNVSIGDVSVQNGILQLSGGNAIGDTARVTLANHRDTVLELLASETIGRLEGGQRQTNGDWGVVDVGGHTLTINQTAASTYSGRFAGTGTIIKTGATNMTFGGHDAANGFTGTFSVAQGLAILNGAGSQLNGASDIILSGSGSSLRFDNDQTTAVGSRINDIATITLSSTAGTTADALGFYMRRTAGTTTGTETVGQLVLNTGHNTIAAEGNATDRIARINFVNAVPLVRNNLSTLFVTARNFAATAGQRGRISFSVDPGGSIGGGGLAGTSTLNIYPYMVGEDASGAPSGAVNFGNTFVYYETGTTDLRPLNLTTEYVVNEANFNSLGAGVLANNVRFTATPAAALDSDTTGVNALVLDSATGITVGGSAQPLQITSGAILSAGAGANVINGFTSLTTGTGNPYYIYVTNPTGTLTLAATTLGSSEALVKSGAGTLLLGTANSVTSVNINQGVLEIGDLDHIGGNAGNLRFAGGTLRLGAGFSDDISSRTITFLVGGGTLDTNGIDLTLAGGLGSGAGGFTKAGAGNLTLNGTATYTGNSLLSLGTVTIGANNALGNGGNLTLAAGATLSFSGSQSLSHGLVTTSGASPAIIGSGTITASRGFLFNNTGDISISATLAGAGGVFKTQNNMLTLSGLNTYSGTTEIQAGTISFESIGNIGGGPSALGNPATAQSGIIRMGLTTAATTLTYTGSGHSTNRLIGMQGTTGGVTLNADGSGAISYGGARFENAGNKTLTLGGAADPLLVNSIGTLTEIGGVLSLTKTGDSTWQLSTANNHSGVTTINVGALRISHAQALGTTAGGTTIAGDTSSGVLELDGGITVTDETLTLGARQNAGINNTHVRNVGGNNTWAGNINFTTGGSTYNIESAAGSLAISGTISGAATTGTRSLRLVGAASGTVSGTIVNGSATVNLTKAGAGVWTLSNANTYSGGTTVSEGTLLVVNTLGSATGTGAVTVSMGATLGGNGFIAPAANNGITVDGTLQVGAAGDMSAQQLTITTTGTGLVTVNNIVAFDLFSGQGSAALNDATHNDQLVVSGSNGFAIGAGAQLHVSTSLPIDGSWVVDTKWKLFDWTNLTGGVTGTFANLADPAPFNYINLPDLSSIGLAWDVSNLYTEGTIMVVVPEPGRMLLLFLGLMGLFFRRRR